MIESFACRDTEKLFNDQRVRRFQSFERQARKRLMVLHAAPSLEALMLNPFTPPNRISEIVNGKRSITADTALRLQRYFGVEAQFWLNLQTEYDLRMIKRKIWFPLTTLQIVLAFSKHVAPAWSRRLHSDSD